MNLPQNYEFTYGLTSKEFSINFPNKKGVNVRMPVDSYQFRKKLLSLNPQLDGTRTRKMDFAIHDLLEKAYVEFDNPKIKALGYKIKKPKLLA